MQRLSAVCLVSGVLAVAPAAAQLELAGSEGSTLNRVVVLPSRGTCAPGPKSSVEAALARAAQGLDPNRYEFISLERVHAEQMNLGEDVKCGEDACWMGILGKLGIPYALRAECMDVAGELFVTARFYNTKVASVMATREVRMAGAGGVDAQLDEAARKLVSQALDVPVADSPLDPPPPKDGAPRPRRSYVMFACEFPLRSPPANNGRKAVVAQGAVEPWARQHGLGLLPIPQTFEVPPKSLGKDCTLDSTHAKVLSAKAKADGVVWLVARDVKTMEGKRAIHSVGVFARVYNARLGRYSRPITRASAPCPAPVLEENTCLEAYGATLGAVMDGVEVAMSGPDQDF